MLPTGMHYLFIYVTDGEKLILKNSKCHHVTGGVIMSLVVSCLLVIIIYIISVVMVFTFNSAGLRFEILSEF